jgi:hypothetical protein
METSALTQSLRLLVKVSIIGFVVGHLLALGMRPTVEAVLLTASTSVADPKVMLMAVIAALVIFIMLLGTVVVFRHRAGLAELGTMPR